MPQEAIGKRERERERKRKRKRKRERDVAHLVLCCLEFSYG